MITITKDIYLVIQLTELMKNDYKYLITQTVIKLSGLRTVVAKQACVKIVVRCLKVAF